jgi:hypothetical protein
LQTYNEPRGQAEPNDSREDDADDDDDDDGEDGVICHPCDDTTVGEACDGCSVPLYPFD